MTEMPCCKNCECEKKDHADTGAELLCLFAPTRFEAMTPEQYLVFLTRTMGTAELNHTHAMPHGPLYPPMNIALPPKPVPYLEPSYVWAPFTINIGTPSSYTLCGSIVA